MRLSEYQIDLINQTVLSIAGPETDVYLFGSRLNDAVKGGDIDLFIESATPLPLMRRARIKIQLESMLCLPVDLVCKAKGEDDKPFHTIARNNAVKLTND